MHTIVRNGDEQLAELRGKNVVLFMGTTGAGKSTLANAMISGIDVMEVTDEGYFKCTKDLMYGGRHMFKIGDTSSSCTVMPGFYPFDSSTYLVDCPGLGDSNPHLEFPNQTLVHNVIKHANKVMFLIVLRGADLESERQKVFLRLVATITRMLSDSGVAACDAFIRPVINNPDNLKTKKRIETIMNTVVSFLDRKEQAFENGDTDFQQQFAETIYPQPGEFRRCIQVVEAIKHGFVCVSPIDDSEIRGGASRDLEDVK